MEKRFFAIFLAFWVVNAWCAQQEPPKVRSGQPDLQRKPTPIAQGVDEMTPIDMPPALSLQEPISPAIPLKNVDVSPALDISTPEDMLAFLIQKINLPYADRLAKETEEMRDDLSQKKHIIVDAFLSKYCTPDLQEKMNLDLSAIRQSLLNEIAKIIDFIDKSIAVKNNFLDGLEKLIYNRQMHDKKAEFALLHDVTILPEDSQEISNALKVDAIKQFFGENFNTKDPLLFQSLMQELNKLESATYSIRWDKSREPLAQELKDDRINRWMGSVIFDQPIQEQDVQAMFDTPENDPDMLKDYEKYDQHQNEKVDDKTVLKKTIENVYYYYPRIKDLEITEKYRQLFDAFTDAYKKSDKSNGAIFRIAKEVIPLYGKHLIEDDRETEMQVINHLITLAARIDRDDEKAKVYAQERNNQEIGLTPDDIEYWQSLESSAPY